MSQPLMWGHQGYIVRAHWRMSLLIDPFTDYWMVDDTLLSNSDYVIQIVYLVLRLEKPKMSYMSTSLFDTKLVCFEALNLA